MSRLTRRVAVSSLFLMNGFLVGNWAPKIPEFAKRLELDESQLGLMIAIWGIGALVTMPITGVAIARLGTLLVTRLMSMSCASMLIWLTCSPNIWTAAGAVFIFGSTISGMDVAMNALAVEVERERGSSIMSSCHGCWSLGGLVGALVGGYLLQAVGVIGQAIVATLIAFSLVGMAWGQLWSNCGPETAEAVVIRFPYAPLPYLIGFIALLSALPEGAVLDWSALYLRQEIGAGIWASSFAFGAFSAAMAAVRFVGDPLRDRFGAVTTVRGCSLIAMLGLLTAGLSSESWLVISGFAIAGLGLSNLVPIAFSAAGNLPGLAPGIGLSVATTIGYSGFMVAPAAIGFLAERTGFGVVFALLPVLLFLVLLLSPLLRVATVQTE